MYNKKDLTNLTDKLWQNSDFFSKQPNRKRKHWQKEILRAIIYLNKTGCQWRMLPCEFPTWQLVYYYFQKWMRAGVFDEILENVRNLVRKTLGKELSPSVGVIDIEAIQHVLCPKQRCINTNIDINFVSVSLDIRLENGRTMWIKGLHPPNEQACKPVIE